MSKNDDRLVRLQRAAADGYLENPLSFWNDAGTTVTFSIRWPGGEPVRLSGKEVDALLLGIHLVEAKGRRAAVAAFEARQAVT